jgi:hypothetical protein
MMTVAFCLYGLAQIDPLRLMAAFGLHFLLGWVYLVLATLASSKVGTSFNGRTNPFRSATAGLKQIPEQAADRGRANPFHPSGD